VAAIDCGTNSIRLLIADVDSANGSLIDVQRRMEIVRLGAGVDRTGQFAFDALERTFEACRLYATLIRQADCDRVRFVATSATRDVRNRGEFVGGVRHIIGVEPEVVSGQEEAALSFNGATRELAAVDRHSALAPSPFLVVDIGGGSTEFVVGDPGAPAPAAASVDIGCVRMTERHLQDDPPTPDQVSAAAAAVDEAISGVAAEVPLRSACTLIGLAGSVTTVAAMALDLPAYQPERIHHARISSTDVRHVAQRLLMMSHNERAKLPFMHPGRVDVIGAGALILSRILAAVDLDEVLVSEHDILDGIAASIA
jgi:exopolyphosphatase/guanosine-5'-triphosphate,3'-diphosphate pyrophosphatase